MSELESEISLPDGNIVTSTHSCTPTPADAELHARVQLEAARKHLRDCREREGIAFEDYHKASGETIKAMEREREALASWFEAVRPKDESGLDDLKIEHGSSFSQP